MNRLISASIPVLFGAVLLAQDSAQSNQGGWRKVSDPAPPPPEQSSEQPRSYQAPPSQITLPAGAYITVRVNEALSSDHNRPGDAFTMTLAQPLIAQGFVVARRGQTLGGRVSSVEKAGRIKGTSQMAVELTDLSLVDGQQIPIRSELIQYSGGTSQGRDATAIATTTGVGAAIGAVADGGFGAGVGAAAGAAASVIGVLVTRGRPTVIYPEDTLTFRTLAPIPISTDAAPQAFLPVQQSDYQSTAQTRGPVRRAPAPAPYYGGPYFGGPYFGYPYPYYGPYFYGPRVFIYGGRGFGYGRGRRW
jgi:hypothetical protein